jgi:hypothetical protein
MSTSPLQPTPSPGIDPKLQNGERRSSFGFLRRQKSTEGKMIKKQKGQSAQQQRQANIPRVPPQLPSHAPLPNIGNSFDSAGHVRPDSYAILANSYHHQSLPQDYPPPPQPEYHAHAMPYPPSGNNASTYAAVGMTATSPGSNGDFVDPYARTESMTHRGRYSYASSAVSTTGINSPRRVRRRKDPTPFK